MCCLISLDTLPRSPSHFCESHVSPSISSKAAGPNHEAISYKFVSPSERSRIAHLRPVYSQRLLLADFRRRRRCALRALPPTVLPRNITRLLPIELHARRGQYSRIDMFRFIFNQRRNAHLVALIYLVLGYSQTRRSDRPVPTHLPVSQRLNTFCPQPSPWRPALRIVS